MPRLNVVVPVYNGEKRLARLLDSLMAQTFGDFHVMIIDNASEDATESIAKSYAAKDPRISYHRNVSNLGFGFSYLRGYYSSMDYEYMVYMSHSDYLNPQYFAACIKALDDNPKATLAYSYCQFVDDQDRVIHESKDDFNLADQGPLDRYATILSRLGFCNAFYGLIRMSVYTRMFMNTTTPCAALDNLLLAGLGLAGPFVEIPELFLVREWTDSNKDTDYLARCQRLASMGSNSNHRFHYLPFYNHIYANFFIFQTALVYLEAEGLIELKDRADWVNVVGRLASDTVNILYGRYRSQLDFDLNYFVETVVNNKVYDGFQYDIGDIPVLDCFFVAKLLASMEELHWLVKDPPANFHLTRAILYLWRGRREEALLALESELKINPISRVGLELKGKLQKVLNA